MEKVKSNISNLIIGAFGQTANTYIDRIDGTSVSLSKAASSYRVVVKSLSTNKKYTFRTVGYCPAEGAGKPQLKSPASKTFSATTAPKDKPKVKSITISDVKQVYHKSVYYPGHMVGSTWYPSRWSDPYYTTNFTVKSKVIK